MYRLLKTDLLKTDLYALARRWFTPSRRIVPHDRQAIVGGSAIPLRSSSWSWSWSWWLPLLLAVFVGGCSTDMTDLEAFIAQKRTIEGTHPAPIKEPAPYVAFDYPGHQRDPFDSTVIKLREGPVESTEPDPCKELIDWARPLEYLESFPLDTLRMVGMIEQDGLRWALVQTPDKTIQRVKQDHYMGLNRGRIMSVTETKIQLVEVVPDGFGCWKHRGNEIALSD